MAKKPEDIKKQKEKELSKKRKALQKRQKERAKYDVAYAEKIKDTLEKEKNLKKEKKDVLTERLTSPFIFIPVIALLGFSILCAVSYIKGYKIFSPEFTMQGLFHCLYAGDLSIGISSRLLIGSILTLFNETLTAQAIDTFARTFLYISFALQSLFTAFVMRKGIREGNAFLLFLSVIFLMNPVTVCAYTYFFGVLDLYNYVLFIIAVMLLVKGNPSIQLMIPVISIAGLLIHYSFFFAFFPALFVLGLYRTVNSEGKQFKKEAAALGANSVISVGGFFYLTLLAKNFLAMNSDEMLAHVHAKADETVFIYDNYLMYYIYDVFLGTQMENASQSLSELININKELTNPTAPIKYILFIAPVLLIFWAVCAFLIRNEKGRKKLPFIAACVMPLALIPELILSSDTWRWIASTTFCLFYVLFAFSLMDIPSFRTLTERLKNMKPPVKITAAVMLFAYLIYGFFFNHVIYT